MLAGANEEIMYDAKPHVGTDVLLHVVQHIRNKIISLGGEVRFNAQVTNLPIRKHRPENRSKQQSNWE